MNYAAFRKSILDKLTINKKVSNVCVSYLLFLMSVARKHSLEEAASFSGKNKSQFSRFLKNHSLLSITNLNNLSKKHSKILFKKCKGLQKGSLPWRVAIIVDATIQNRSSIHTENSQKFNHGNGYVIGHQWTNIVLIINETIIPLMPIPFYSKNYCKKNKIKYKTEHEVVIEYFEQLNLYEYIGYHSPEEVVVLADSGYDDKRIENVIKDKKWHFIFALKKKRSVKSKREALITNKSQKWRQVADFFKSHRWAKWQTVGIQQDNRKKKRMEFRIRQIIGHLRYVGMVQLICSEFKKRSDGRRKYLACSDLKAKARQILIGYRLRWLIEIFHKQVKMFHGFQDVAPNNFNSVISHVHWVYCAYILMNFSLPGIAKNVSSQAEKQKLVGQIVSTKEKNRVIQMLSQFGGVQRYKEELQRSTLAI